MSAKGVTDEMAAVELKRKWERLGEEEKGCRAVIAVGRDAEGPK